MAEPQFDGRTALVTGAAGDFGRAGALALAAQGATVIAADHPSRHAELAQTVQMCGSDAQSRLFDVTELDDVRAAIDGLIIDIAFNNAGYQGEFANLVDADPADFAKVLAVNVVGVFNVMQSVALSLSSAGRQGSIVNTASMAGVGGAPNMAAYSASKAAVIGLTKTAAKDLAPLGIRVNAISPAFIGPGAMWERQVAEQAGVPSSYYSDDPETVAKEMISQVPLRRYGTIDEVMNVVAFLLSDAASYVTGTNTEISGGAS